MPSTADRYAAGMAIPEADSLGNDFKHTLSQHLQHMPGHIYMRTGQYAKAVLANLNATASDTFLAKHLLSPYGPGHNAAFLVYAATMSGQRALAYKYSDHLRNDIYGQWPDRPDGPGPEQGYHIWRTAKMRFGDFDAVVNDKDALMRPLPYAHVLGAYAKGVSMLKSGMPLNDAEQQYAILQKYAAESLSQKDENPHFPGLIKVANASLLAAIEDARGNLAKGTLPLLKAAAAEQESWAYDEPPSWHWGIQECIGIVALRMGDQQGAISAFGKISRRSLRVHTVCGVFNCGRRKRRKS